MDNCQVDQVQGKLCKYGYFKGKIDGLYGPITAQAVKAFQQRAGIKVDGIIGPQTIAKLFGEKNQKSSNKRSIQLQQTFYCSSCNFTKGIGYGSTLGCSDNKLIQGYSIAVHENQECFKLGRQVKVNGKTMRIDDKCGTYGVVDIWRGQKPLQSSNNKNCQGCNKTNGSGDYVTVEWQG